MCVVMQVCVSRCHSNICINGYIKWLICIVCTYWLGPKDPKRKRATYESYYFYSFFLHSTWVYEVVKFIESKHKLKIYTSLFYSANRWICACCFLYSLSFISAYTSNLFTAYFTYISFNYCSKSFNWAKI